MKANDGGLDNHNRGGTVQRLSSRTPAVRCLKRCSTSCHPRLKRVAAGKFFIPVRRFRSRPIQSFGNESPFQRCFTGQSNHSGLPKMASAGNKTHSHYVTSGLAACPLVIPRTHTSYFFMLDNFKKVVYYAARECRVRELFSDTNLTQTVWLERASGFFVV